MKLFPAIATILLALAGSNSYAQTKDAALFLNAESDTKPRQISLGLPINTLGAVPIFVDGLPVSYYIYQLLPYKSWHGGVSAIKTGKMEPFETALRNNEIGNYVDSYDRLGDDHHSARIAYTLGSRGQNKFDINLAGPLRNGWAYSVSTYQNFDPGSNHCVFPVLLDRHQFYKAVLSKTFHDGKGQMSFTYQHVDFLSYAENYGPFIFMKDGSVKEIEGFSLGIDSYRPALTEFNILNFKTGQMQTMNFDDANREKTNAGTFRLTYRFDQNTDIEIRSRFREGTAKRGNGAMGGNQKIEAGNNVYTYQDGTPFSGDLQRRILVLFDAFGRMWMNNVELNKRLNSHKLRLGLDHTWSNDGTVNSSAGYAHEVKADPKLILRNGEGFYQFNTAGEYYEGDENRLSLYAKDTWRVAQGREISGFVRAQYRTMRGEAANNIGDDTSNTRYAGFSLLKGKITPIDENFLEGAAGIDLNWRLNDVFSAKAQGIFTRNHVTLFNYGGYSYPSTDPIDTRFAQAGISYKNSWLNIVSQLIYMNQSNNNSRPNFQHTLQKAANGYPAGYIESIQKPINYGIESIGWTTDAIISPAKGLSIHAQFTIRDPKYYDFTFDPTFSDGVTEHYDFSGNNVTGLHKVEFQIDPSYSYKEWRFWFTGRYISKQYINKTNTLAFKERIETFGGIDYKLNKKCSFTLNVINILNQKGASGSISSADLAQDATGYDNYLMSGTFIRPFTVELGINLEL